MSWLLCGKCCHNRTEAVRKLDYSHSLLQEIPSDVFVYERTLEKLYVDSNHIMELPRQLFNCDELRMLNLSDNEISFLPPAISSLVNLHILDISKNAITNLPENIRACLNLSVLDLSINPLEKFPDSLINLISLTELYLTDIYLEFLPANFGKLVNLRILELRENNLATLPKTMSKLVHLTRLDIGSNDFSELPEVVTNLHNITELWIDGNHIRRLSASLGQLRKMIHFEASNNNIESLPRDIGYWTRVVEFSISNNDLSQLPTTIGNMKNLVSLKLDENQLRSLPDSIGKLTNLEELMISHNYLVRLPASLGLLRKLQMLIADRNKLIAVPSELGSCTSLSIFSLRGNRISEIPAEIGHLSSLRVLNLVDNQLNYLPVSLLKLDKLSALWLSNNQSQPLVPLQQELHADMYQTVLTCFMLPQVPYKLQSDEVQMELHQKQDESPDHSANIKPDNTAVSAASQRLHRRHICFASDASISIEQPGRLMRAPTPYPKELRALAKHAKNIQRVLTVSQHRQTVHSEVMQPVQDTLQIKEAKVTVTPHIPHMRSDVDSDTDIRIQCDPDIGKTVDTTDCVDIEHQHVQCADSQRYSTDGYTVSQPVLALKCSPVIREAKNIRTDVQNQQQHSMTMNNMLNQPAQPPPYHIAAAYSLQAQYFNVNQGLESELICETEPNQNTLILDTVSNIQDAHNGNVNSVPQNERQHLDNKPRTFIQDKPSPGQHILAPTPKRPSDYSTRATRIPYLTSSSTSPNVHETAGLSPMTTRRSTSSSSVHTITSDSNFSPRLVKRSTVHSKTKIPTYKPVLQSSPGYNTPTRWLFGQHRNATVVQVTLQKNPDLGFSICAKQMGNGSTVDEVGIFVNDVVPGGPATDIIKLGDKILEVDGIDFTKLTQEQAMDVLLSSGSSINMMISHIN